MMNQAQSEDKRRRFPWWIVPVVLVVIVLGGVAWLFRFRLQRAFEPRATSPPPPPTRTPSAAGSAEDTGVLYETSFENPDQAADWEQFDDGVVSASITGGQLLVAVDALVDTGTWSGLNFTFGDFVLNVDAAKREGSDQNGVFVIFHLSDNANYNRFDVTADGYYKLARVRDGVSALVSDYNVSEAINQGDAVNHLQIEAVGGAYRFRVNDTLLDLCISDDENVQPIWNYDTGECQGGDIVNRWVNEDITQGKIGLGAQAIAGFDGETTTPARVQVTFDNLVLRAP